MAASGHLEFWCSNLPKYKNGVINGLTMPHLVGKMVLHRFLCPFIFKFHFQYGRWRPFWILASPKFRRHFREGHGSSFFSKYSKELKPSVKPYYSIGGHGIHRYNPTIRFLFLEILPTSFRLTLRHCVKQKHLFRCVASNKGPVMREPYHDKLTHQWISARRT